MTHSGVSAGLHNVCALRHGGGGVVCWGKGDYGGNGDGLRG